MSAWDDFEALLDKAEPPGPSRNPPMRALERGKAELFTEEERRATLESEMEPDQRAAHRRAIADQRDPARRQILQEAYDQDTQASSGNPLDFGTSTGDKAIQTQRPTPAAAEQEKSDAELGAEILSQYGNKEPPESAGLMDSIRSGVAKGIDLVTNVLRPRGAADRERQEGRIREAGRDLNQTQRDVIERQRQTAMRSAAQPELREEISRMRVANLEADRDRKPRPYPEARIANLERQALPVNALNVAERAQMDQAQAARDVAMGDFWRNVGAGLQNLDPMFRGLMGGFLQAYGEALNAELDARGEALDENLTGEVSDARRMATKAADMGRTIIDQADIIEKENIGDLRPGIAAQTVNSAVHSLAMMAPALAGGWLVRSPHAVIAIMSSETGAKAYGEARKEGLSPGQSGVYALLHATIEGGTEYSPAKALFADAPEGALKWFLNFLSKEVGQELLATGLQDAVDKVSVRPEMTWQDFAHDVLLTMTSTPLAAGAQAGAVRAVRGAEQDDAGRREEIMRKFRVGIEQFEKVTEQAASAARAEREARGPATHTIEGMPVRPRVEGGQPVPGIWETDEGDLVEAPRAEPLKAPEPNAEWTVNGVQYEVEIVGPGREENTARLADGQEVPLTEFRSIGDEAKALLGIEEDLAGVKPVTRRRPARGEEPPPPPGSRRPDVWPPPGFTLNPEEARRPEFTGGENKWDMIRRRKEESREAWMRRLRQRASDRKAIDVDRDTLTDAIIKLGGINVSERLDLSGDDKSNRQIPFVGYLFTRQGDSVDGMAEKLYELGYIEDRSDVRALAERIRDELGGFAQHWSAHRSEAAIGAQMQAEAEAQQQPEEQELANEADELARAPLHYDISPEDLAERELEPNAANIVIADLLSQLDENTRERLSMQYADADDETFIEALRNELARGEYGTQTTPGTTGGRQARQLPPQYEVKREGEAEGEAAAQPIGAVRPVRTAEGRLKAFGEKPEPRMVERAEDVVWDEYMDYYKADINGRLVSIWKPTKEKGGRVDYQVIVSGSMTQLTNEGRAATLAEAQRLAFAEHEKFPEVRMDSKGRVIGEHGGRGTRTRVEQPVQIYGRETADEWVARMKRGYGDKWMEQAERVIAEMKRSLPERPMRAESEVGYSDDQLSLDLTRNMISAMEMALTKAKSKLEQPKGGKYAPEVRGDEGQVQGERDVGEKGERQGRADLQRAEKARAKASDRKAPARLAKGEILKRVPALQEIMRQAEASKLFKDIRWRLELPRSTGAIYKVDKPTIVIENIEAAKPRTGAARALLKRIYQAGGQVIPEELDAESYPFWAKMADEGLAEGQFFLEEKDGELTEREIAEREADERGWGEAPVKIGDLVRIVDAGEQAKKKLGPPKYPGRVGTVVSRNTIAGDDRGGLWSIRLAATERGKERVETFFADMFEVERDESGQAKPAAAPEWVVGMRVKNERGSKGDITKVKRLGDAVDVEVTWDGRPGGKRITSLIMGAQRPHEQLRDWERLTPLEEEAKPEGDLFAKPAEPPQPKLTGPEPPLLTTPEGVAPPRDVEEQKVPTEQLKLFQRTAKYRTTAQAVARAVEIVGQVTFDERVAKNVYDEDRDSATEADRDLVARLIIEEHGERAFTVDYAAQQAEPPASEAQAEAGNYSKGHWIVGPKGSQLDISIETPEGERRNPDWPPLKDHYGYIKGTIGFDKDHLDVFVKPGTRDDFAGNLYVVNQVVGSFDEHKVMLGYSSVEEAREAYLRNYEQGWDGLDSIIPMTFKGFAQWSQTKGARGPQGGPLTLTTARRFDEVSKPTEGTDRDQGAATPQLDLFSQTAVPGEKAGEPSGVLFERIVVESETVGKIRLPVGKIQNSDDAASAFSQLAKSPREQFHMIALNEQDEPIAYYPLFLGSVTQTSVYPREVWLALYQTPGAKKVWLAHNHPSGVAAPSRADEMLTETLRVGLDRDLGLEYMGHVIIAGNKAHALELGRSFDVPSPQAGKEVAIRERVIKVEESAREPLTSPGLVRDYLRQLKTDKSGLVLMDAQHRVIAYYYMTPQEMTRLRTGDLGTGFARLMRQVGRNNPAAAIAYFPGREYSPEIQRAVSNVGGALEGADVRMLDAFTFGPVPPAQGVAERMDAEAERPLISFAERGHTLTLKPFYSLSGRWSDMTVMRVQEELMSDPLAQAMRGYIEYVDNPYQLPQDAIDDLLDMGGIAKVAGVWSPTRNKVFLVASNMQPGEARTVLLHELVGHHGMDQIFGEQYVDFMLDVYRSRAGDIQAQARPGGPLHNYQFDFRKIEHQLHAAAEFIAHAAERGEEPTLWQRFVAMVRLWLREHGFVKHWSDTDILMLLQLSKNALINGGTATYNGKPAFNLKAPAPIWRSTLMDRVREFGPARATQKQWVAFFSGMMQRGVKPDEIEWTGLREWLATFSDDSMFSKEEVLRFLTEHGVQINERILGELYGGARNPDADRLLQERDNLGVALDAAGYSVIWDPNGNFRGIENRETNILYLPPGVKPTDVPGAERAVYHSVKPFEILRQRLERVTVDGVTGAIHTAVERLAEIAPTTREFGDIEQTAENVTRYESWTLPGGRNYREILLTLPVRKGEYDVVIPPHARQDVYNPPHFDTLNLLAHVRFNERTDADGKRVLFVEEFQSDWAEEGRKYRTFETEPQRRERFRQWAMDKGYMSRTAEISGMFMEDHYNRPGDSYWGEFKQLTRTPQKIIPRAPFVQKTEQWSALLVKRVIRYAAEHGFERIAWTTGAQQVARYSLWTQLRELEVTKAAGGWQLGGVHQRMAKWQGPLIEDKNLDDYIGRDLAARVREGATKENGYTVVFKESTLDRNLVVGPKAMIKFYDEIMPNVVNNVLKKVGGGKVREIGFHSFGKEFAEAKNVDPAQRPGLQPGFDITPAMRDAALRGLPMFALRDDVTRMAEQIRVLSRRVDQAYRRGARNAEDLDAELAALRGRYYHAIEQLEGELETEAEAEDAEDFTTPEEQFRNAYWQFMAGQITQADYLQRMRDVAEKPRSDEQLIAAGRDALAAWMARAQRRSRFSLREPRGVREVYGVREGRLLGMAVRRGLTSGLWDVYLATGANESMFTRGQFRREQAGSLNEVNQMFNREGLELNVIKPRNIPLPDTSLFDRDWVAPRADSLLRKTIINFQNRLLLPELYERTISREVGAIPPEARAHREARLAHPRAAGKIADFEHEFTEPLVDLMRANGFTLKDVGMYLYARHAPERNAAIEAINPENRAGSGMTDARAAAVLQGLRDRLGARFAAMEQIGAIANNISRFRENVLIDKGLAKLEAVALMQQKYPNYVPLKEMAEDEDIQSTNNETKGGYQVGRLLATAFGRFTEAQSEFILPALVAQAKGTISAGENAEVLRSLLRLVEYAPNPDVWRIQKHVWKPYIDKDTGQVQYAPRPIQIDANYSSRAISVPVNGERVIIVLGDQRLAQAFKQSGLPLDKFSQTIGVLTRFYALMATAANPEFVLTNLIRDFQQAVVRITGEQNTKLAASVAKDVPLALWGAFAGLRAKGQLTGQAGKWHRWYRRYIEAGGHIAYRGLQDVETQHKDFLLTLAENGIMPESVGGLEGARLRAHRGAKVVGAKYVAHLIMDANGAVENALRLSAFKNAVEAGWSEKDAAMLARNVTVDFNLKGEWSTRFGAYFMFLNANVQGTALLFRSVMNHRAIQALALLLFLSGMGFDWWNDKLSATEPDGRKVYDNINNAIKERNFILMTPDGQAAVTAPLPFGFNVFYVAGVHAMSAMRGAQSPLDAAAATFVTMINAFNPLGQSPETKIGAIQLLTPTFLDPTVQAITNRNWFDRSIVPERSKNAPPQASAATYYAGTPAAYVDVSTWLNEATGGNEVRSGVVDISPNMLEHWTRSIFGSAGAFVARVGEFAHTKMVGEELEVRNVPFLRRFYYEPKDFELSHRFYENLNAAEVAHYEVQRAYERGQPDKARAFAGEFSGERAMYLEAQGIERLVGQLRSEVWKVRKNERLTDEQRKKQVEQLQERIRQAMMMFNKRFEERAER